MSSKRFGAGILLFAGLLATSTAHAQFAGSAREVFTRSEIEAAAIHRFSDLVPWLATAAATVEGLAWNATVDFLRPRSPADPTDSWALTVDGQPVETRIHGNGFPELLPVTLQQVDSIVIIRSMTVAAGRISPRGSIEIHTAGIAEGATVRGWARTGGETGDPGPLRYTPLATPNVDRSGPDYMGLASYGSGSWGIEASGRRFRAAASDSTVHALFDPTAPTFAFARGGGIRLTADVLGGTHRFVAAHYDQLGPSYFPRYDRIVATDVNRRHVGLNGEVRVGRAGISYRLTHGRIDAALPIAEARESVRDRLHASTEVSLPLASWQLSGGVAFDGVDSDAGDPTTSTEVRSTILTTATKRGERLTTSIASSLSVMNGGVVPSGLAAVEWRPVTETSIHGSLGYTSQDAGDPGATLGHDDSVLQATIGVAQPIGFGLDGGVSLVVQDPHGEADLDDGAVGAVLVDLALRRPGPLQGRLVYMASRPLTRDGSDRRAVPAHQLRVLASFRPNAGFRIGTAMHLRSAVYGPEDDQASRVAAIHRIDLSAEKWLWSNRLRAQIAVANVLDTVEQYHPRGAPFALRAFFGLAFDLP